MEQSTEKPPCFLPNSPDFCPSPNKVGFALSAPLCEASAWGHDVFSQFAFPFPTFILFFTLCSGIWPVFHLLLPLQCSCPQHCWVSGQGCSAQGVALQPLGLSQRGSFGVRVVWCWSRTVFIRDLLIHTSRGNRGIAEMCVQAGSVPLHQDLEHLLWDLAMSFLCAPVFQEVFPSVLRIQPGKGVRANSESFNP